MAPFPANHLKQNCKLRNVISKWQRDLVKAARHNRSNRPATTRGERTKTTGILRNTPKRGQHKQSLEMNSTYGKPYQILEPKTQRIKEMIRNKREPNIATRYQNSKHAMHAAKHHRWKTRKNRKSRVPHVLI